MLELDLKDEHELSRPLGRGRGRKGGGGGGRAGEERAWTAAGDKWHSGVCAWGWRWGPGRVECEGSWTRRGTWAPCCRQREVLKGVLIRK